MKRAAWILLLFSVLLAGCVSGGYRGVNPAEYLNSRKAFDLTIGWNLSHRADGVLVDGYVRNNRYFIMNGLTLVVSLQAADGSQRSSEMVFIIPMDFRLDEVAPFTVSLGKRPQPGDLLHFQYRYVAIEGNDDHLRWMNDFTVPIDPVPAPDAAAP